MTQSPSPLLRPLDDAVARMSLSQFLAFLQENEGASEHNLSLLMSSEAQQEFLDLYAQVQRDMALLQGHYLDAMQIAKSAAQQVSNEELE